MINQALGFKSNLPELAKVTSHQAAQKSNSK
jgi:hypothetical protein